MQPGVAGPFAGISGDALIVAGGSNFPDKKPWEGGKKAYVNEVYVLERSRAAAGGVGAAAAYHWYSGASFRLPFKVAYGASVTTPGGIVCIGGETPTGFSKKVFLLQWVGRQLRYKALPDLPIGLANAGAALIGNTVYLAGGENAARALASCFSLDLAHPTHWQMLPDVPIALSHCAVAAQGGMLYVIGGRSKTASGISALHNTVFRYDPSLRGWRRMHPIGDGIHPPHLAAANVVADDDGHILVIGGDDGRLFHQLETLNAQLAAVPAGSSAAQPATTSGKAPGAQPAADATKRRLLDRKLAIIDHHPGFCRGVLRYDPALDQWTVLADLPVPVPVTTVAVRWDHTVVIPCGEVKPGIRSAEILVGSLEGLAIGDDPVKMPQP